jgi:glycosyltransferase involved in cell wall biosynthesis
LVKGGYDVSLVVTDDHPGRREAHDVEIIAIKRSSRRLRRMLASTFGVAAAGWRRRGAVYHFHDPELIPIGLALRLLGKRVIYDAHEDLPRDILSKDWVPRGLRGLVSRGAAAVEWIAGRTLSGIVAATPTIARRFPHNRTALVQNFARHEEFAPGGETPRADRRAVAYVGGITLERCAIEMIEAIAKVERFPDVRLLIAGPMSSDALQRRLAALKGWTRVDYLGVQSRAGVSRLLSSASVGLAVFHPFQSFIESQPVKMFEYMAAGLPIIAANFPRFREIVEDNGCGICVPPRDPAAIAAAIEWVFEHPTAADEMGRRGQRLVVETFNWDREAETLLHLYDRILGH